MQIKYNIGPCSGCNKERLLVQKSKKLCAACTAKASAKRTYERKKKLGKIIDQPKLTKFYNDFYQNHATKTCFETGAPIYNYKNWNCHHLLEKRHYPQHMFNADVCILLTLEQHSLYHSLDQEGLKQKMPKSYARLIELQNKYL